MEQRRNGTSAKVTAASMSVVLAAGMMLPTTLAFAETDEQLDDNIETIEETNILDVIIINDTGYDGDEFDGITGFDSSAVEDFTAWLEGITPDGYVLTAYSDVDLLNQITTLEDITSDVTMLYIVVSGATEDITAESEVVTLNIFDSLLFNGVEFGGDANEAFATFLAEDLEAYITDGVMPSITFTMYQTTADFESDGRSAVDFELNSDVWSVVEDSENIDDKGTSLSGGVTQYSDTITIEGTYNDETIQIEINTVYMVRDTWMIYYYDQNGASLGSYDVAYSQGVIPEDWDYEDDIIPIAYYLDADFTEVLASTDYLAYVSEDGIEPLILYVDYEENSTIAGTTILTDDTTLSQTGDGIAAVIITAIGAICAGAVAFIHRKMSL